MSCTTRRRKAIATEDTLTVADKKSALKRQQKPDLPKETVNKTKQQKLQNNVQIITSLKDKPAETVTKSEATNLDSNSDKSTACLLDQISYWKNMYLKEADRRKNNQRDLVIEKDRSQQLRLELQSEKQEKAKLWEMIGSLKTKLANKNDKHDRSMVAQRYDNGLINVPCTSVDNQKANIGYPVFQSSSFKPTDNIPNGSYPIDESDSYDWQQTYTYHNGSNYYYN